MHRSRVLCALLAIAPASHAAVPVSTDQSAVLERQIREWLVGALGQARVRDRPVQVTAEEAQYRLAVTSLSNPDGPAILTAAAKPLDAGTWALDQIRFVLPAQFTALQPRPQENGVEQPPMAMRYTVTAATQDGRGLWDPALLTPSTISLTDTGLKVEGIGVQGGPHTLTQLSASTSTTTLRPVDAGHMDVMSEGTADDYRFESDAGPVAFGLRRVRAAVAMTGIDRSRAMAALMAATTPGPNPVDPRSLFESLRGLADTFVVDETGDGLTLTAGGFTLVADSLRLGMDVRAVQALLDMRMRVELQGITPPPALPFGALIPRSVVLNPHISGLASKDVLDYLAAQADPVADKTALTQALIGKGGMEAGLDSFTIMLSRTTLSGAVTANFPTSGVPKITAELSAVNFDDLQATLSQQPFAAQAVPVLLLIKGLGRVVGDRLMWTILSEDGHTTINGTDLSALSGRSR